MKVLNQWLAPREETNYNIWERLESLDTDNDSITRIYKTTI